MTIILNIFVVFALTLILTKSKIMAGKREFVELRYEASKVGDQRPGWVHKWWHALITCPMCSGFWVAIPVCFFYPAFGLFVDVLVVFGANWLIHCLENLLFFSSKMMEYLDALDFEEHMKTQKDFYNRTGSTFSKMQRNFQDFVDKHS